MQSNNLQNVLVSTFKDHPSYRFLNAHFQDNALLLERELLKLGISDFSELSDDLKSKMPKYLSRLETILFRPRKKFFDGYGMFKALDKVLIPMLMNQFFQDKKLQIWVPNCGQGREIYSVAIQCIENMASTQDWDVNIVGTDIDSAALDYAHKGNYPIDDLHPELHERFMPFFKKTMDDEIIVEKNIRDHVTLKCETLFQEDKTNGYEAVVLRGFLKFMTPAFQQKVIDHITHQIKPHGFLILGADESLMGLSKKFKPVENMRGFYQKTLGV